MSVCGSKGGLGFHQACQKLAQSSCAASSVSPDAESKKLAAERGDEQEKSESGEEDVSLAPVILQPKAPLQLCVYQEL